MDLEVIKICLQMKMMPVQFFSSFQVVSLLILGFHGDFCFSSTFILMTSMLELTSQKSFPFPLSVSLFLFAFPTLFPLIGNIYNILLCSRKYKYHDGEFMNMQNANTLKTLTICLMDGRVDQPYCEC